ncbi:TPA: hypothetical protein ACH3X2_003947 [Trebouxia sp. C0005]
MSRATSVATSLISRTHSTFLQGHKNLGLKRKSLWTQVTFVRSLHDVGCSTFHTGLALGMAMMTTNHELDNSDTQDSLHAVFEYQNQGTTQVHLLRCVDI